MNKVKKKTNSGSTKKPQALPGMIDILPGEEGRWDFITQKLQKLARGYGFSRVEVPMFENSSLFDNVDVGDHTLISFGDPEGNKIAVRPETLPGIMRAFIEHKVADTHPLSKWYYISPVVVYDEKQKKFVNSWEYGFELFGEFSPLREVQLISLALKFLNSIGLDNLTLEVNSVGKSECRVAYEESLRSYLQGKKYELCNECVASIETYPLQIFRCKNLECQTVAAEAPQIMDALDEDCHKHFAYVLEALDEMGIAYSLNPMLVGKEGSSRTIFSIRYKDEHNEYFIGEATYHEDMLKEVTGKAAVCFGFVGFLDVLQKAVQNVNIEQHQEKVEVFLVPLGELASKKALRLFSELWDADISVHGHFGDTGVKNQLRAAEASKAMVALIIGQKEAMDEMVILRDVRSGMQEVFQYERIIDEVKKRLGR